MQVSVEELAMLLGQKTIEIYALQKQVAALQAEGARLKKPEPSAEQITE